MYVENMYYDICTSIKKILQQNKLIERINPSLAVNVFDEFSKEVHYLVQSISPLTFQ